jgi:hypothetical protein
MRDQPARAPFPGAADHRRGAGASPSDGQRRSFRVAASSRIPLTGVRAKDHAPRRGAAIDSSKNGMSKHGPTILECRGREGAADRERTSHRFRSESRMATGRAAG